MGEITGENIIMNLDTLAQVHAQRKLAFAVARFLVSYAAEIGFLLGTSPPAYLLVIWAFHVQFSLTVGAAIENATEDSTKTSLTIIGMISAIAGWVLKLAILWTWLHSTGGGLP